MSQATSQPRYVIADGESESLWSHIIASETGDGEARDCHFVFDTETNELITARFERNGGLSLMSKTPFFDLEDSLLNANADALENPTAYGLRRSDTMPAWAI